MWMAAAGILQGAFALPLSYMPRWKWENAWFSYSCLAFLVLPLGVTLAMPSHFTGALQLAPARTIAAVGLLGFGWGVGSVFFGLGIRYAGMALGLSIMTGLINALGTLVPMAVLTPRALGEPRGRLVLLATLVTFAGVAVCGYAGHLRDSSFGNSTPAAGDKRIPLAGALAICVAAGVFSAMFNFGYAFSGPISQAARRAGATPDAALNTVWLLILSCGLLPNAGYCLHKLTRDGTWRLYHEPRCGRYWLMTGVMAAMWLGGTLLYGVAAGRMGDLGPSLGWAAWNAVMILVSVTCGLLVGEWRAAPLRSLQTLAVGTLILLVSVALLGCAGAGAM
jgi:L-rhamnose-H+ transport protein